MKKLSIEKLNKINILLQRLVYSAGLNNGLLTTYDCVDICREVAKIADEKE